MWRVLCGAVPRRKRTAAFCKVTEMLEDTASWTTRRAEFVSEIMAALQFHGPELQYLMMAAVERLRAAAGGAVAAVPLSFSTSAFEADSDVRRFVAPRSSRSPTDHRRVALVFESDFWTSALDCEAFVSLCVWVTLCIALL
jgi:hypothetical protein